MRPIIHNDISGFLITEEMVNRYEEFVPEPGPQPADIQVTPVRNTFGSRIKNFFGYGVAVRPARVRRHYQRNY